jgi:hypothetical protein
MNKNQIFKSLVSKETLFQFLDKICIVNSNPNIYIINNEIFKKAIYDNVVQNFITEISDCYHTSKKFYVERKMDYNSFVTIVRQVCKLNNITITNKIKYFKSNYSIEYEIYKN